MTKYHHGKMTFLLVTTGNRIVNLSLGRGSSKSSSILSNVINFFISEINQPIFIAAFHLVGQSKREAKDDLLSSKVPRRKKSSKRALYRDIPPAEMHFN